MKRIHNAATTTKTNTDAPMQMKTISDVVVIPPMIIGGAEVVEDGGSCPPTFTTTMALGASETTDTWFDCNLATILHFSSFVELELTPKEMLT